MDKNKKERKSLYIFPEKIVFENNRNRECTEEASGILLVHESNKIGGTTGAVAHDHGHGRLVRHVLQHGAYCVRSTFDN